MKEEAIFFKVFFARHVNHLIPTLIIEKYFFPAHKTFVFLLF